jgi:integrase
MKDTSVSSYLHTKRTPATKSTILTHLTVFFRWQYPEFPDTDIDTLSRRFIASHPSNLQDIIEKFIIMMRDKEHWSPNTIANRTGAINKYLKWNKMGLDRDEMDELRDVKPRTVTIQQDRPLTREMIGDILTHCDPMMKAFVLLQSSSGMRMNEVHNLHYTDMRYEKVRRFYIPRDRMKQGRGHWYRISKESYAALLEWNKIRDARIQRSIKRTMVSLSREKKVDDDLIFPFDKMTIYTKWREAASAAGYDDRDIETGKPTVTMHGLRKWFITKGKSISTMSGDSIEALVGHETGLSPAYRRYTEEELDEIYLKLEPYLNIQAPKEYAELQGQTARELDKMKGLVANASLTIDELKQKQEDYDFALAFAMREITELKSKKKNMDKD